MTESAESQRNLMGHVKEAIDEWNSIEGPTKGLAETIVGRLHYYGFSYNPANDLVADTFERAARIAQSQADTEGDWLDRDACEYLAAIFLERARAIRKVGPRL